MTDWNAIVKPYYDNRITHIIALSGGKDSTAMALRLAEVEPMGYQYVITPTGNEPEKMIAHWDNLAEMLGQPLTVLAAPKLEELMRRYHALPNWRQRWCTRQIKIEPFNAYIASQAPAVSYVGLRADEPAGVRRGAIFGGAENVTQRYPLREWGWGLNEVWEYLDSRGISIPERTDCEWCFYQTLPEWWNLWRYHSESYARAEAWETVTAHTFRSPSRDTWPAELKLLRAEFEKGRIPKGAGRLSLMDSRSSMCRVCSL